MENNIRSVKSGYIISQKPDTFLLRSIRSLMRNPSAMLGLLIVIIVVISSLFADSLTPYNSITQELKSKLQPPSINHLMGTDMYGRDILTRVLSGGQTSLRIGLLATLLGTALGVIIGIIAGYIGGTWEVILMRFVDSVLAFPTILIALTVIATIGTGEKNVIYAIGFSSMPLFARLVRADTLRVKNNEYISAAIISGCKFPRLFLLHLLPNVSPVIIAMFSLQVSRAILYEASLSFLGVGTQPPTASWGLMVATHRGILNLAPWTVLFPSLAITLTILGLNLLGDGLRDALDPKLS